MLYNYNCTTVAQPFCLTSRGGVFSFRRRHSVQPFDPTRRRPAARRFHFFISGTSMSARFFAISFQRPTTLLLVQKYPKYIPNFHHDAQKTSQSTSTRQQTEHLPRKELIRVEYRLLLTERLSNCIDEFCVTQYIQLKLQSS